MFTGRYNDSGGSCARGEGHAKQRDRSNDEMSGYFQKYVMIKGSKGIIDACLHAIRCIP